MKCLALSAGSERGSFQAGVLLYLLGDLKINYDMFCGSSVGSINAAFLAQFKTGEEKEASESLKDLWLTLTKDHIYKEWFGIGKLASFWKSSIFNSKPLHKLIEKTISLKRIRSSGKKVAVSAVSIQSGKQIAFNQDHPDFIKAVIASASFPGAFKPVKIGGHLYTDAGLKQFSPIQLGIDQGAIDIDLIMTVPEIRVKRFKENPNALEILFSALDFSTDKLIVSEIERIGLYNKLAEAGLCDKKIINLKVVRPDYSLIDNVLNFDPAQIFDMITIGYKEAKAKYKR